MPSCYFAHPVDFAADADLAVGRQQAIDLLTAAGFVVYDPAEAWYGGCDQVANNHVLDQCDTLYAWLPVSIRTIGVGMELERALGQGKPCVVWGGAGSWALRERVAQFDDPELAVKSLRQQWDEQPARTAPGELRWTGGGKAPYRAYPGDAGYDLTVSETTTIPGRSYADIPCGISVELPHGYWGYLIGRSSTLRTRKLLVNAAVIDNGYRGPLFAGAWNLADDPAVVREGDRLAQLIPIRLADLATVQVAELGGSERGVRGFGSSGL